MIQSCYLWNNNQNMDALKSLITFLPFESKFMALVSLLIFVLFVYTALQSQRNRLIYMLLFLAIATMGSSFILIEPLLNTWDEQFHALVAKNLAESPLTPQLISYHKAGLNPKDWVNNTIWLHKQPLFLWQMAACVKIFGAHYWSIRIPSMLLHAATTLAVFAIAKRFLSPSFSILAAAFYGYSFFILDFVSGTIGMDHNDISFIFYVTASCWAYIKYCETKKWKYVLLIGAFSGCAVLTKWLVGLLVFSGWGLSSIVFHPKDRSNWKAIFTAFGICCSIFIPWQLFCMANFPVQFWHEMAFNSKHFFEPIENHSGDNWYYVETLKKLIGSGRVLSYAVLVGWGYFLYHSRKSAQLHLQYFFIATVTLVTFLFFTVAATKLDGYLLIIAPYLIIFMLIPFQYAVTKTHAFQPIRIPSWAKFVLILVVCGLYFQPKKIIQQHNFETPEFKFSRKQAIQKCLNVFHQNPHASVYLIKGFYEPIVPALRFETSANFLVYYPKLENKSSVVIDLSAK